MAIFASKHWPCPFKVISIAVACYIEEVGGSGKQRRKNRGRREGDSWNIGLCKYRFDGQRRQFSSNPTTLNSSNANYIRFNTYSDSSGTLFLPWWSSSSPSSALSLSLYSTASVCKSCGESMWICIVIISVNNLQLCVDWSTSNRNSIINYTWIIINHEHSLSPLFIGD